MSEKFHDDTRAAEGIGASFPVGFCQVLKNQTTHFMERKIKCPTLLRRYS